MMETAERKQYARVIVAMDVNVTWANWAEPEVKSELAAKESALLAELGDTVLQSCVSYNPLGLITVYATPEGLRRLAVSTYVRILSRSYGRDAEIYDPGGWLDDIENEIEQKGSADILAVLNLENFAFDFGPDGNAIYKLSDELGSEIKIQLPEFLASLPPGGIVGLDALKAELAATGLEQPLVRLRILKEGLYSLQKNRRVRSIRLTTPSRSELPSFASDVLDEARSKGYVDVSVDMYRPLGYSILDGYLPAKAIQAQKEASRKAWDEIYSTISAGDVVRQYEWGAFGLARFTLAGVEALYRVADRRIQRVYKQPIFSIDFPVLPQDGPLTARTIRITMSPSQNEIGKAGGIFVAAYVPQEQDGGGLYFLNADGIWTRFLSCEEAPAYYVGALKKLENIPLVAVPTDLSALVGSSVYAGFGIGESASAACRNMVNNGTYMNYGSITP